MKIGAGGAALRPPRWPSAGRPERTGLRGLALHRQASLASSKQYSNVLLKTFIIALNRVKLGFTGGWRCCRGPLKPLSARVNYCWKAEEKLAAGVVRQE